MSAKIPHIGRLSKLFFWGATFSQETAAGRSFSGATDAGLSAAPDDQTELRDCDLWPHPWAGAKPAMPICIVVSPNFVIIFQLVPYMLSFVSCYSSFVAVSNRSFTDPS
jgi:hypothetical protein